MKLTQISILFIALFVASCSSPATKTEDTQTQESIEHEATDHANHTDNLDHESHQDHKREGTSDLNSSLNIELENGEKWKVNQEMMPAIQAMKTDLQAYTDANSKDYQKLATTLDANTNLLVKSCTMQGKSHEELHKWLEPHMALVKDLKAAKDESEANEKIQEIQHSFELFNQYFK